MKKLAMREPLDTAVLDGVRNPAPGLWQALTGDPLPTWTEMRTRYPALPPLKVNTEKLRGQRPDLFEVDEYAAFRPTQTEKMVRAVVQAQTIQAATDAGEVDFRAMLKDDDAAWSARNRLAKVLRREYLATSLVDQLDPETAAKLADRLDTLVSEAVAETELRISGEVSQAVSAYSERLAVDREARRKQAEEARHERFNRPSRLS